ncbi:MAG TPA: cytochrome C oxidase subunit IV family protein [Bacteroidia bacterium]
MEFHDNYPQYEMMSHHTEEEGKKKRRKLWNVFWVMLGITLIELFVGSQQDKWGITGTEGVKWFFIIFTILKAYFIVYAFMHLGDENRLMKWLIIGPYAGFVIYLISMTVLGEGNYASRHKLLIDPIIQMQHAGGGEHGGGEGGGEHK